MQLQRKQQLTCNEGKLYLAIKATQATLPDSIRHASRAFSVPETTLRQQRAGRHARRDCEANLKKLTKTKEEAIVARILKLDKRGIGATRTIVEEIANDLRAARGEGPVGKH
jgi:hypothetical protein